MEGVTVVHGPLCKTLASVPSPLLRASLSQLLISSLQYPKLVLHTVRHCNFRQLGTAEALLKVDLENNGERGVCV